MSYYSLWIDKEHAFIYEFDAKGVNETKLEAHGAKDQAHTEKFFHEVAKKLGNAKELMIMGPGVAKDQFKHHLESHHHQNLAKSVVGIKSMTSHPTKAEMLKSAGEFFKTYHQWTQNY